MAKKKKKGRKADQAPPAPPVFGEVAAVAAGEDFGAYVDEIARPNDPLLSSLGWNLDEYRALLRDHQVKATWQQRRDAVIGAEWAVEPGGTAPADKAAAKFLEEQLDRVRFDAVCRKMFYALWYGYAVGECFWGQDGRFVTLERVKVRKPNRFLFGRDDTIRLIRQGEPSGVVMPDRKLWTFTVEGDNDDEPHGLGLAHYCYWPVFLKRNVAKFWSIALEKFGAPTPIGRYPFGTTPDEITKLLETLYAMVTDSAVALPEGFEVDLLEATRQSGGDHAAFCRYWDAAIAKVNLSVTMTTDDGASRAQSEVHKDVRDEVVKSDADLQCESFNAGPAVWLTEWNFPGAKPPRVWRDTEPEEDLDKRADRDKKIVEMGYRPTLKYVHDTYGGEWTEKADPVPAPAEEGDGDGDDPEFAEADEPDPIDVLVAELAEDGTIEEVFELTVAPVVDLAGDCDCDSYEEFENRLTDTLAEMNPREFAKILGPKTFAARIAGRAEVAEETGEDDGG